MEWLQKLLGMGGGQSPFGAMGTPTGGSPWSGQPAAPPSGPAVNPGAGIPGIPTPAPPGLPGILGQNQNAANNLMNQGQKLIAGPQMQAPSWMPWMR